MTSPELANKLIETVAEYLSVFKMDQMRRNVARTAAAISESDPAIAFEMVHRYNRMIRDLMIEM